MSVTPTYLVKPLHELTDAWRRQLPPPLRETCVCGGDVISASKQRGDVLVAVQRHQIEPVHIAWDLAHGVPLAPWQLAAKDGR